MGVTLLAIRFLIAGIFLRAGLAKAADLKDFRSAVANYQLLPKALIPVVAVSLPFLEVAAAILLVAGILTGIVSALLAFLLLAFAAAIAINLARGRTFDCGCAGTARSTISWAHVLADVALAALAAVIALAPPVTLALWPGVAGPFSVLTPRGAIIPVLLTVILALVLAAVWKRARSVRDLSVALRRQLPAAAFPPDSGRH